LFAHGYPAPVGWRAPLVELEINRVAVEIREAAAKRDETEQMRSPILTSKRFIQRTIDEMNAPIDNAALDRWVALVRDLMDQVTVVGREEHAVAIWRTASDDGVNRSDSVSRWLRRAGAGRLLNRLGVAENEIPLPHPEHSRAWLNVAILECAWCGQVAERTSPVQRHCPDCRAALKRARSVNATARARAAQRRS
jgi:hypothetical protein